MRQAPSSETLRSAVSLVFAISWAGDALPARMSLRNGGRGPALVAALCMGFILAPHPKCQVLTGCAKE